MGDINWDTCSLCKLTMSFCACYRDHRFASSNFITTPNLDDYDKNPYENTPEHCFNCESDRYVNPNGLCNKCQTIKDKKIVKKIWKWTNK